jgi:hypothetical protein
MWNKIRLLFAAESGNGPTETPAGPTETPAGPTETPAGPAETPAGGSSAQNEEAGEEWKGWWAAQLPKEIRDKHKDALLELKGKQQGEVYDDYFASKTALKNAIVFPGKDAKPEEIETFLKRMDIPKTSEEYGLKGSMFHGYGTDEEKAKAAKEISNFFKSIGLTKTQGQKLAAQYAGIIDASLKIETQKKQALSDTFEARLLKETGDEKAAIEAKEYFKRAMIALKDKRLMKELKESGALYSPSLVRAFADIYKAGNLEPPMPQAGPGGRETRKDALPKGEQFNQQYGGRRD